MKKILSLAIIMPMLVIANNQQKTPIIQPKSGATNQKTINPNFVADGGIKIIVGNNSQIQVYYKEYSTTYGVHYSGSATPASTGPGGLYNSVYLTFENGSGHTSFANNDDSTYGVADHELANVSQSNILGDGSEDDPYRVTTVLQPDNAVFDNVRMTLTDTYTVSNLYFDRKIELDNLPTGYTAKLFWGLRPTGWPSCYMQGAATPLDRIGVYQDNLLHSLSAGEPKWEAYQAGIFNQVFNAITNNNGLDDSICTATAGTERNAYAGQWNVPDRETSYSTTIRLSYTGYQTVLASYQPSIIDLIDDPSQTTSTLTLTVSNVDRSNTVSSKSFDYTVPDNIELLTPATTSCTTGSSADVITAANLIKVSNIELAAPSGRAPASCTITYQVGATKTVESKIGSFDNTDLDVLSNDKITFAQASAMLDIAYQPEVINMSDNETATLNLSISNYDTANLSAAGFDYTLPSNIEIVDTGAIAAGCPTLSSSTNEITATGINLAAASGTTPTTCQYQFSVKGKTAASNMAGSFANLSKLASRTTSARITTTGVIPIPTTGLLGLLMLVLISIGFGRYYFKR